MVFDYPGAGFGQPLGWLGLGIFLLGSLPGIPLGNFLRARLGENRRMYRRAQAMVLASKARMSVTEAKDRPLVSVVERPKYSLPVVKLRSSTHVLLRLFFLAGVVLLFLWTWARESPGPGSWSFGPVHPQALGDYLQGLFGIFEVQVVAIGLAVGGFIWSFFGPVYRGSGIILFCGWILLGAASIASSGGGPDYQVFSGPDPYPGIIFSLPETSLNQERTPYRRIFFEGYRIPVWIQLLGYYPVYLSSYRLESGALLAEDPQIPWVFLLRPDPNFPPETGYLLSPLLARIFSSFANQGLAEPFAVRSGFLEISGLAGERISLFGGIFSVLLPPIGR